MHSLLMNHAFIDGNKRTATVAMLVYLAQNTIKITIKNKELITTVLLIEKEKWNSKKISEWLKTKTEKITCSSL